MSITSTNWFILPSGKPFLTEIGVIAGTDANVCVKPRYLETVRIMSVKMTSVKDGGIQTCRSAGGVLVTMESAIRRHKPAMPTVVANQ
jgi:hypothetical protein